MAFLDLLGSQKGFICSYNCLLGPPGVAPKVWKWVSDAYPVNMGQLDHHVGFLNQIWSHTRLLEGQKVPYRGQTDPPWTPYTPQKPSWTVPTTNIVHLVTSQLTSNPQMPKCTLKPKKCPKTAQKRQKCKNAKSGKTQNWPILIPHPTTSQKLPKNRKKRP